MVVLHAVGLDPGGEALRATLRSTQTPRLVHRAAHASSPRGMTIAAQSARSRLDNFARSERYEYAANAREASRTSVRSWHTPRLPQRLAPREQSSAAAKEFAQGVSQRRRRLYAPRWVAPHLLRRGISTALRVGAVAARRKFLISSLFHATASTVDAVASTRAPNLEICIREHPPFRLLHYFSDAYVYSFVSLAH